MSELKAPNRAPRRALARPGGGRGAAKGATPYRVLARKYRPARFEDLIGQEPMVRTLANSFAANRIHQAYILTGVRGVGKTTTARILARAFNYSVPGKIDRPSIDMPELGVHCQAIMESRHVDVIEMDAASHTGIDDVREIIENARYRPVSARTKVYIVDEVHMLSKQAFNGLLKTLEEPPEHVKFLFATTEIEKVPVTVRSRCIRFDLKRIETGAMVRHLEKICAAEGVVAEPDALALIARVAEGSVRDALSLLDQGIAHGAEERVAAADMRAMLGLSDRGEVIDLFVHAMAGEIAPALESMARLHLNGADPAELLDRARRVLPFRHPRQAGAERRRRCGDQRERTARGAEMARKARARAADARVADSAQGRRGREGFAAPARLGRDGADPSRLRRRSAEPEDALRKLAESGEAAPRHASAAPARSRVPSGGASALRAAAPPAPAPERSAPMNAPRLARFEDVVALARVKRDIQLCQALEGDVRLARFEPGRIEFSLVEGASSAIVQALSRRLAEWTGERWMVALAAGASAPTLREQAAARQSERLSGVADHPVVRKVLERFPGARIVDVRAPDAAPAASAPAGDEDVAYADSLGDDDL